MWGATEEVDVSGIFMSNVNYFGTPISIKLVYKFKHVLCFWKHIFLGNSQLSISFNSSFDISSTKKKLTIHLKAKDVIYSALKEYPPVDNLMLVFICLLTAALI